MKNGFSNWCVVVLCMVASIGGCSGPPTGSPDPTTIRVRLSTDPPSLDPAHGTDTTSGFLQANIFEPLVKFDPTTMKLIPAVAESWQISDDGTVYTFHLRHGVKFHNGREVTAADFQYSFERLVNPKTRSERAWVVNMISGTDSFARGETNHIAGIETPDRYTLVLRIDKPNAVFIEQLAMSNAGVVPKEVAEKWGADFSAHPVGCGPFKFVSWKHDVDLRLDAFADYYGGKPRIEHVRFRVLPDDTVAYLEYKTGGLDLMNPLPSGQLRAIRDEVPDEFKWRTTLGTYFLSFNMEHEPFKNNKALRQAFNYAVNKKAICDELEEGRCTPAHGILPPDCPGYNKDLKGYPYNPEKAKRLLSEAGYPGGTGLPEITLWYNTSQGHQAICEYVQAELAKIGVRIKLKNIEWAAYLKAVENGEPDFFRLAWIADYPDPDTFLYSKLHSSMIEEQGKDNESRYRNPKFDALLDRARAMTTLDERLPLYQEAERIAVEDAPWVFIYYYGEVILVKPWVKGFVHSAQGYFMTPLADMWIETETH